MWYKKRIAMDVDTGRQFPVVTGISDWEDDISPTSFFGYFSEVPVHNAITQCLETLDLTELISGLSKEEETKEGIPDSRIHAKNEGGGMGEIPEERKREGKIRWE